MHHKPTTNTPNPHINARAERRAATIVLKENNCHLLRVDKEHFNRILRDVEANTLRLQEHNKDVLVLERVAKQRGHSSAFKYVLGVRVPLSYDRPRISVVLPKTATLLASMYYSNSIRTVDGLVSGSGSSCYFQLWW